MDARNGEFYIERTSVLGSVVRESQLDGFAVERIAKSSYRATRGTLVTKLKIMLDPKMQEAEAIEGAQKGNDECFQFLYARHKRRVYSLCFRMLGSVEVAEDFTQEAFLQIYRKIGMFRGDSAFSTWLHRVTVNVVLMHLRKRKLPEVSLDEIMEPIEEGGTRKEFATLDQRLAGSIDRVMLERAIESLPPGYRIIFVLHDIEGYEHGEIGEMLGCSTGNSKSQLHKARIKLRDQLMVIQAEKHSEKKMKVQRTAYAASGRDTRAAGAAL
jgi:RNA polymerase sigma-70 factor (ECF subfamily)